MLSEPKRRWEETKKSKESFKAWGWRDGVILWSRGKLSPENSYTTWMVTDFQAVIQEQDLTQWPGCPSLLPSNNTARAGRRNSGSSTHSGRETGIPSSSAEINRLSTEQRAVLLSARGWWNAAELRPTWVKLVAVNQWSQLLRRLWRKCGGTGVKNPQPSCLSVRIRALRPHPPPVRGHCREEQRGAIM